MAMLTIGGLSKAAGVKVTTIRYYESTGLMGTARRSDSGQRRYDEQDVERLSFVRHARELGFSMDSIRTLLELQTDPGRDCAVVDGIARAQLADVQTRIAQLSSLACELERMITSCEGGRVESCRVLATLGDHGACADTAHPAIARSSVGS